MTSPGREYDYNINDIVAGNLLYKYGSTKDCQTVGQRILEREDWRDAEIHGNILRSLDPSHSRVRLSGGQIT